MKNGDSVLRAGTESSRQTKRRRQVPLALQLAGGVSLWVLFLTVLGTTYPFANRTDYAVGGFASSVTTGDFDGDSHLDLAAADGADDVVSIVLGNGDGTFGPKTSFPAGTTPRAVVAARLDDDDVLDLVTANASSNDVSILLGNGDGTFAAPVHYSTGPSSFPKWVITGRFDDDLDLDLAVANFGTNNVSVFLGHGDGTFADRVDYATGVHTQSVAAGYFDDDLDLDLVSTDWFGGSVLLGNGDGTFAAGIGQPFGSLCSSVTTGYFNADADVDLVMVSVSSLRIWLGNGDGSFELSSDIFAGGSAEFVTAAHLNDDAHLDLVVNHEREVFSSIEIRFGNGDGTFQGNEGYNTPADVEWVTTGRFDDDPELDLATANRDGTVSVLLDVSAPSNGEFAPAAGSPTAAGYAPTALTAGHFDDDTLLDLAVANLGLNSVSILLGNGDGSFPAPIGHATGLRPVSVTTGHFDDDTDLDLAVANADSNSVSILLGNGDGTFAPRMDYSTGSYPSCVTTGHFDNDCDLDLAVTNQNGLSVSILLGNGDGTFAPAVNYPAGSGPVWVTAGHFDDDAGLDLAISNFGHSTVAMLLGNGNGTFAAPVFYATGIAPRSLTRGHFDEDADLDLAVVELSSNSVSILLGNGDGTFAPRVDYPVGDQPSSVVTGHFDDDDDLDLAVANHLDDSVSILHGNGDGTFGDAVFYSSAFPSALVAGCFDDDTDLDLAVANYTLEGVTILLAKRELTPPTTTIARTPALPNGANGWYASTVGVSIFGDDGAGSGVVQTRCDLLGPLAPAPTFDSLPAGCSVSGVSTDGEYVVYAASMDAEGNKETPVSAVVKLDATPPVVTPAVASPGPVFVLGGAGGNVVANVTDATSGASTPTVSAAANVSSVGQKTVQLVGSDNAGNATSISCPYVVSYHFPGFLPPVPQGTYQRGSTIPLKFKLANAAGTPISDAAALALLAGDCKVKLTVDGVVQTGCATYDAASDKFQRNWKVPQSMSLGDHTLGIQVSAPDGSGVVNTNSILVTIR